MGFGQAIQSCFSKYVTWAGRAPRSEYWFFVLFVFIGAIIAMILDKIAGTTFNVQLPNGQVAPSPYGFIYIAVVLLTFLPNLSALIRRLHDKNKSGWWYWIILIPLVGAIILLVWICQKGTNGANDYGPDPLGGH